MILIRALAFLLHFTVIPVALGRLITYGYKQEKPKDFIETYVVGLFSSMAIFFVLFALLEWHQDWNTVGDGPFTGCFTALCIAYPVVMAIFVIRWIIKDMAYIKGLIPSVKAGVTSYFGEVKDNRLVLIYAFIALVLLFIQLYFAYGYQVNEWSYDDYDYVVASLDTISNDELANNNFLTGDTDLKEKRAAASWTTQIAYLSKVSGFEVTTVAHTIIPVLFLLIAYGVYYYIARLIIKEFDNRLIFMILLQLGFMFGNYSHYSLTFRLLCVLWQGKAVLSAIAIPFWLAYMVDNYSKETRTSNMLPIAMVSLGICSLTTMSMILIGVASAVIFVVMSIYNRKIASIRYLIASMIGPCLQFTFYILISWLLADMKGGWPQHFTRGRHINWWYRWFG